MKPHAFKGAGGLCAATEGDTFCNLRPGAGIHELAKLSAEVSAIMKPEPEQFWPGTALSTWQVHSDAVLALLKKKQAYGNAWQEQGYMGNLARILSKTSRLKNMMWRDPSDEEFGTGTAFDESVLDTLLDLSALCALAISNINEGNRWGRG